MTNRSGSVIGKRILLSIVIIPLCATASAESKWKVTPAADLVSSYVWRGAYQTGTSFQPALTISYGEGLSLGAWGSTDFSVAGQSELGIAKEVDFTLGYSTAGFGIALTDYWWAGEGTRYGHYKAAHFLEGTLSYSLGECFNIAWNTMIMEGDGGAEGYKQLYSTYVKADWNFETNGVACTLSAGVSPWTGIYHRPETSGFALSTLSFKASKELKVSESLSLPLFAETIFAPNQDNLFLVVGISF
jgi:hypothetical protein